MRLLWLFLLIFGTRSTAAQPPAATAAGNALARGVRAAYASYQAGRYGDAAAQLERLEPSAPRSAELHELLGLTYAAQARNAEAVEQFKQVAALEPASAAAKNNLATALVRTGQAAEAEHTWHEALALSPEDFNANRNLARLYLQEGKLDQALPLLMAAHRLRPGASDNSYDLALAYLLRKRIADARMLTEELLRADANSGELHALLARIDEEQARFVDAANEFASAARLDPSEDHLFAWAGELLLHRAYEAAIAVFKQGTERYPQSPRLWVGLGISYYSRGEYERSIHALLTAADLNAQDPRCYLFLSKAYLSSPAQADEVIERFRRYAALKPNDALAQFYYAMSLWKGRRVNAAAIDYPAVEELLERSIALDPSNAEVHLELGILYNDQHKDQQSLPQYQEALRLNPSLADAHFRLGRYYLRVGEKEKAQAELDRFKVLQAEHQAAVDKERAEVQQFVVATGTAPSPE